MSRMNSKHLEAVLVVATLSLAACSKKDEGGRAGTAASATAAPPSTASAAPAASAAPDVSNESCRGSDACRQSGECVAEGAACVVKNDDDCRRSEACKETGACGAAKLAERDEYRCVPKTDADCKRSEGCKTARTCVRHVSSDNSAACLTAEDARMEKLHDACYAKCDDTDCMERCDKKFPPSWMKANGL